MDAAVTRLAESIDAQLAAEGTPERAERERSYLHSELHHHGTPVPDIRRIVRASLREHPELGHDEVVDLATSLWDEPVHERRMAAVEVLADSTDLLGPDDSELVERFLREARTWALVDGLSVTVVGTLADGDERFGPVLDRWAVDDDLWLRRAALLSLLVPLRKGAGDVERFGRYADAMLDEREFFVAKAIGWVLRDTAKRRPELVADWLLPRADRASTVTIREAVKYLPDELRRRVLAAR